MLLYYLRVYDFSNFVQILLWTFRKIKLFLCFRILMKLVTDHVFFNDGSARILLQSRLNLVDENSTWFWAFFLTESEDNFCDLSQDFEPWLNPKSVNEIFGIKSNIFYTFFVINFNVLLGGFIMWKWKRKYKGQ